MELEALKTPAYRRSVVSTPASSRPAARAALVKKGAGVTVLALNPAAVSARLKLVMGRV